MTAASEKISEAYADKSDEWVAGRVRMLMRNDLEFEPILVAGRDRILRLSRELLQLRAEHEEVRKALGQFTSHHDCEDCWYSCATICCDDRRKSDVCDCGAQIAINVLAAQGAARGKG